MHRAPSPGLCSPGLLPCPERKEGLGFSHGPTAVTGSVSLNYRDTMCINRAIASDPLRQTARGAERVRTNPTVSLVCGFLFLLESSLCPASTVGLGTSCSVAQPDSPQRAAKAAYSLRCWDL